MISRIEIWLKDDAEPKIYKNVINTYHEGMMFCVEDDLSIFKYPIANIFRIVHVK